MSEPLTLALKEWAGICAALGSGRQAILLRKGGVAEPTGDFRLEATRFALYPTHVHQQETGLREPIEHSPATPGVVKLEYWAEVTGVYQVRDLLMAHMIAHLHFWSDEAVEKRFHYRSPGIYVLTVRIHRLPAPIEIAETTAMIGCKSWVPLEKPIPVESAPTLTDEQYRDVVRQLDTLLAPTALA